MTLDTCPYDHPLGPGRVLVSWTPCDCRATTIRLRGHLSTQCDACKAAGRTTVRYEPPHIGDRGGHPTAANQGR